jgi:hypothetical protein
MRWLLRGWARIADRSMLAVLAGLALLFALALAPAAGCVAAAECSGGYVTADGTCVAACTSDKCKPGNRCVGNTCVLPCGSHADCEAGQSCAISSDDEGKPIQLCQASTRRPPFIDPGTKLQPGGYNWLCPFGDADCAAAFACPNGRECDPMACADCAQDAAACGGDPLCNIGKCGDGTACTFNTCPAEQCTPFECIGEAEGDAFGYCSHHDCSADADCPAGFYCGDTRDPHDICGNTCSGGTCSNNAAVSCTTDSQCQRGNIPFCGVTEEPCLDITAANAATGAQYFEGAACLLRKTCLRRDDCARCTENLDCSLGNAQVCGAHAGQDVCLRLCNAQSDCRLDEFCVAYVAARGGGSGTCGMAPTVDCATPDDCPTPGDTCVPRQVCVPAAGACDASDSSSKFCRHCVSDEDCGGVDKPGRWACVETTGGEFGCLDLAFGFECSKDADCPISPGGRHGECFDTEVSSSSSAYMRCYFPRCDPNDPIAPCLDIALQNRYTCN